MKENNLIITIVLVFLVSLTVGIAISAQTVSIDELESRLGKLEAYIEMEKVRAEQKDVNYMYGVATAYTPSEGGINADSDPSVTATMQPAKEGIIAVNPNVIPFGSQVMIIHQGTVIRGVANDTGGAMRQNPNQVDILMECINEAREWGRKNVHIIFWQGSE